MYIIRLFYKISLCNILNNFIIKDIKDFRFFLIELSKKFFNVQFFFCHYYINIFQKKIVFFSRFKNM